MSEGSRVDLSNIGADRFGSLVAAAHELKTPLSIISQLAASIDDELLGLNLTERQVALQRIRLSAERSLRLVRGLTISHRLNPDDQLAFGFVLEPLNVTQLCEETIQELLPLAAAHNQVLCLTAHRPQLVVGNSELLRSVFCNLLDNAISHNPPGASVNVDVGRRQAFVRVCVQDAGPGLGRGKAGRLRQTIGKQLQPLGGRAGSSGLGLYIASSMAQAMGGRLGVGNVAHGADFHIDLLHSKQLRFL